MRTKRKGTRYWEEWMESKRLGRRGRDSGERFAGREVTELEKRDGGEGVNGRSSHGLGGGD